MRQRQSRVRGGLHTQVSGDIAFVPKLSRRTIGILFRGRYPDESVTYIARVHVPSRYGARGVDAKGESPLKASGACARRIEGPHFSVAGPQEGIKTVMAVIVIPRD